MARHRIAHEQKHIEKVRKHFPLVWILILVLFAVMFLVLSMTGSAIQLSGSAAATITSDLDLKLIDNLQVLGAPGKHDIALGFSLPCNSLDGTCADISDYEVKWRSDRMITIDNWETSIVGAERCRSEVGKDANCLRAQDSYVSFVIDGNLEPDTTYFLAVRYMSNGEWSQLSNIVVATTAE